MHDAEAVLLVDDHETQLAEAHVFFDQRVRSDHHVERASTQLRLHLAALLGRRAAGEQRHAEPRRLEQPPDVDVVLLGEDFGRGHEGHLEPVFHGDDGGHQRHDRLAGSDVPLQEPVHRRGAFHVGDDLGDDLLLVVGEPERQDAAHRRADLVGDLHRTRLQIGFRAPLAQDQPELEEEELLEDHPPLRGRSERVELFDRRALGGKVHVVQRRAAVHELQFGAHARGERIGDVAGQLLQRVMHERTLHLRGEVAGLLVDRHDAPGVERIFAGGRTKVLASTRVCLAPPLSACRISYCGFCICSPCEVSSNLPNRITRWCGWKTSFRNGWLNQMARNEPV